MTIGGKPSYYQLGTTRRPGKWKVFLLGPNAGPMAVIFTTQGNDFSSPRITALLGSQGIKFDHYRCSNFSYDSGREVFRISSSGKKDAWLGEYYSCGSAGCSIDLQLFLYQDDADGVNCNLD